MLREIGLKHSRNREQRDVVAQACRRSGRSDSHYRRIRSSAALFSDSRTIPRRQLAALDYTSQSHASRIKASTTIMQRIAIRQPPSCTHQSSASFGGGQDSAGLPVGFTTTNRRHG
jgi:hypothetical protein